MAALVSDSHAKCCLAFERLISALDHPMRDFSTQLPPRSVHDEFDRYKLWAGNVGAPHSGKRYEISLDYRLREASFVKKQVLDLLNSLAEKLTQAGSLILGEKKPFEEEKEQAIGEVNQTSSDAVDNDDDAEDSPWEISSESEHDSDPSREQIARVRCTSARSIGSNLPATAQALKVSISQLGRVPSTEMPRILDSIKFTIACLYRIPIRKPAPLDRIKQNISLDTSAFQHFDVLYVMDKFKDLNPQLASRLGKAITRRRQILYYREAHRERLGTSRLQPSETATPNPPTPQKRMNQQKEAHSTSESRAASQTASSHFTLRSKATTLHVRDFQPPTTEGILEHEPSYPASVAESRSSFASSYAGKELAVVVPERPRDKNGIEKEWFECPYCFISQYITNDRNWRKHVLRDLQPYICTYEDCNLQDYFFEDRDTWFKHEALYHRRKWFCNIETHHEYSNESDFRKHMETNHNTRFDSTQAIILRDVFTRPSRDIEGNCNLCKRQSSKLKSHVSRHLEQMALFSLPRVNKTLGSGVAENNSLDLAEKEIKKQSNDDYSSFGGSIEDTGPGEEVCRLPHTAEMDEDFEEVAVPETSYVTNWNRVTDENALIGDLTFEPLHIRIFGLDEDRIDDLRKHLEHIGCHVSFQRLEDEILHTQIAYDIAAFYFIARHEFPKAYLTRSSMRCPFFTIVSGFDPDTLMSQYYEPLIRKPEQWDSTTIEELEATLANLSLRVREPLYRLQAPVKPDPPHEPDPPYESDQFYYCYG